MVQRARNSTQTIDATNEEIAVDIFPPSKRTSITISNISAGAQVITLSFGQYAVANQGIVLSPGDCWTESNDAGYTTWQGAIYAISDLAGGVLAIQERTEMI